MPDTVSEVSDGSDRVTPEPPPDKSCHDPVPTTGVLPVMVKAVWQPMSRNDGMFARVATMGVNTQPTDELHESDVQMELSLHWLEMSVWTHPVAGLQESAVQALLSLQLTGDDWQPAKGSQDSSVQRLASLQDDDASVSSQYLNGELDKAVKQAA